MRRKNNFSVGGKVVGSSNNKASVFVSLQVCNATSEPITLKVETPRSLLTNLRYEEGSFLSFSGNLCKDRASEPSFVLLAKDASRYDVCLRPNLGDTATFEGKGKILNITLPSEKNSTALRYAKVTIETTDCDNPSVLSFIALRSNAEMLLGLAIGMKVRVCADLQKSNGKYPYLCLKRIEVLSKERQAICYA